MDQVIEGPVAAAPHEEEIEAEAKRLTAVHARNRAKRIERILDFAIMGTVGLAAAAAGLMGIVKVVSG